MAQKTVLKALTDFFNSGDGYSVESVGGVLTPATTAGVPVKRPLTDWRKEIGALGDDEKRELAQAVADHEGFTLIAK